METEVQRLSRSINGIVKIAIPLAQRIAVHFEKRLMSAALFEGIANLLAIFKYSGEKFGEKFKKFVSKFKSTNRNDESKKGLFAEMIMVVNETTIPILTKIFRATHKEAMTAKMMKAKILSKIIEIKMKTGRSCLKNIIKHMTK